MTLSKEVIASAIHSGYLPGSILSRGANLDLLIEVLDEVEQTKPGDEYYQKLVEGTSLADIAYSSGKEALTVISAIKERGYSLPKEYGKLEMKVPMRVYEAWVFLGSPYTLFRQLVDELIEQDESIERVYLGQVDGEPEDEAEILLDELTPQDIEKIEALPSLKGERGDAENVFKPKVRAILEMLVEQVPELEEFRRPSGWSERRHRSDEDLWTTSFSAPFYIGRIAGEIRIPKGTAHSATTESNFSEMMREWLDRFDEVKDIPDLQPPRAFRGASAWYSDLPGGKESVSFITKPVISLTLAARQKKKLAKLVTKGDRTGRTGLRHGQFLAALMLWGQKIDQSKLPGWKEWEEFCDKKGVVEDVPGTLESLEKKGYLEILS